MKIIRYANPIIDRAAQGPEGCFAIRGREQQLIDFFGGVGSPIVKIFPNKSREKMQIKNNKTEEDWRRQGQEKYLMDVRLNFKDYFPFREGWDHDHCEFCGKKFSLIDDDLNQGYNTIDGYHWICNDCFNDFKNEFNWIVED